MLTTWFWVAAGLSATAVFMLAGASWLHVRVLGRILAVERSLLLHTTEVEQLDTRITREVKARAGLARAADAEESRSVLEQAQAKLAEEHPSVVALARPKRVYRR